jgi:serine/threonine-protein kinase mTOR
VQDVLRLLNLWFRYSTNEEVKAALEEGFRMVPIDTWLMVVPQMMARLHTGEKEIINPLTDLLIKVGRNHPQALMYPLLVRTCSISSSLSLHQCHPGTSVK